MVFELGICDFLERQLSEKDAEKCALWAFGEHFKELDGLINFMKAFNSLHSKLLKLDPCGNLFEDISKIIELWRVSENQQT